MTEEISDVYENLGRKPQAFLGAVRNRLAPPSCMGGLSLGDFSRTVALVSSRISATEPGTGNTGPSMSGPELTVWKGGRVDPGE